MKGQLDSDIENNIYMSDDSLSDKQKKKKSKKLHKKNKKSKKHKKKNNSLTDSR